MNAADKFLNRMAVLYGPPETHDQNGFAAEYRAVLKQFSEHLLAPAGDLIRDTHTRKSWPTPGEVRESLNKVAAARATPRPDWDAIEADRKEGWKFSDLEKVAVDAAAKARVQAMVDRLKRDLAAKRLDEHDPVEPDWKRGQRDGFEEMQRTSPNVGLHRWRP